jgi:hypothetical protein
VGVAIEIDGGDARQLRGLGQPTEFFFGDRKKKFG